MNLTEQDILRVNERGLLAFTTITIDRLESIFKNDIKDRCLIKNMLGEMWHYQTKPEANGHHNMSREEAKKMFSHQIYRKYLEDILDRYSSYYQENQAPSKIYLAYCAVVQNFMFFCWLLDGRERALNQNKPFVFDSDITDGGYDWLIEGLEFAVEARGENEYHWQNKAYEKLKEYHSSENSSLLQNSITKKFFEGII